MITVLVDHNIEGQAILLSGALNAEGWTELLAIRFVTLRDVHLSPASDDREVWRFAQAQQMILLTDNRNMKDADSLEHTLREENTPTSLPVVTIGNASRMIERDYRESCAVGLAEIVCDLGKYLGAGRLFIP